VESRSVGFTFAWYRIAFGLVVLLTAHYGWVDWKN